ncbi:MAG: hypothetical protein ACREHD_07735 [Pirellulales bacterium]
MDQLEEAKVREAAKKVFEIEPLEERIAPIVFVGPTQNQGPWVESGGGQVFLGHDPV